MTSGLGIRKTSIPEDVREIVRHIRQRESRIPDVALILGSGLGALAESAADAVSFSTTTLPGYPKSSVTGHAGRLVFGYLEGKCVAFLQGRVHYYEGLPIRDVTLPVRLLHHLGVKTLLVTNAAGGINPAFRPGTLMLIEDHINFGFVNPLVGPNVDGGPRFPDMSAPYDADLIEKAESTAVSAEVSIEKGVYIFTTGPSYETPSEIRAFRTMGADAVGMSTVPEVIQARYFGMQVLGISAITNPAAGLQAKPLLHEEVLIVGRQVREELETVVRGIIRSL